MKKFNASLDFNYRVPFEMYLKERTPLVCAFSIALANYNLYKSFWGTIASFGKNRFVGVECGVYKGASLLACASMAKDFKVDNVFYGLDTFDGLPDLSAKDLEFAPENAKYKSTKMFTDGGLEYLNQKIEEKNLTGSIVLKKGLFSKTLSSVKESNINFLNVDCDLYDGHIECLEYFYPRMAKGGVVFFDDYHSVDYPMAKKAIDVFLSDKNEKLIHLRHGDDGPNQTKVFFIKE